MIEVTTTAYGSSTPFFVSKNEVAVSRDANECYHLYRAFDFRRQPKLFAKRGPLDSSFQLEPSQFVATVVVTTDTALQPTPAGAIMVPPRLKPRR